MTNILVCDIIISTKSRGGAAMSIVRYTNKETGVVSLYESTSHYDPVTKQSRPKRKYLGIEDPETGELIPTSGKRGRKKKDGSDPSANPKKPEVDYKSKYEKLLQESKEKDKEIKDLKHENKMLYFCLQRLRDMADDMMENKVPDSLK